MLYLYDDARAREFEPFTLTRPVSELRAGVEITRHRWELISGRDASAFIGALHLADFEEAGAPPALSPDATIPAGAIIANSRCMVSLNELLEDGESVWRCDGQVCAVRLTRALAASQLSDGSLELEAIAPAQSGSDVTGRWVNAIWDFVAQLSVQLADDIASVAPTMKALVQHGTTLGSHLVTVEQGASVEPYVIFDATAGPILVRSGATISAFTRLIGPCFIGAGSTIVGDRIANCSIGERCKVRGEISSTIVLGYSNKGHTGFVGHSYLGRWVNLGAGTTTSNLKNTYGTVHLWTPGGLVDSGQQFLGTMFGDHVKTGIGTMLTTGTVLGAGSNVFGGKSHPKLVAPFSWGEGEPYASFQMAKFMDVAERMMQRRGVHLTETSRNHLARAHARAHTRTDAGTSDR
jgi:UDP-N-acetylglucosamine diphosphorylase / glucose-1-phosphate thymidylyltransferase / UDP-N-acetylgalactosamine diphosphorylase / glucosamine-1-phosphate N-acetyltransferase / galactosamine-1-phosphate N-acetyltransferase